MGRVMAEPPPAITFKIPATTPTTKSSSIKGMCSMRFGSASSGSLSSIREKKLRLRLVQG